VKPPIAGLAQRRTLDDIAKAFTRENVSFIEMVLLGVSTRYKEDRAPVNREAYGLVDSKVERHGDNTRCFKTHWQIDCSCLTEVEIWVIIASPLQVGLTKRSCRGRSHGRDDGRQCSHRALPG
jgi:hypothetical protein